MNNIEEMTPEMLGYAEEVYEQTLGEETYTFVEGVANPFSCTILVKGCHPHIIAQARHAPRAASAARPRRRPHRTRTRARARTHRLTGLHAARRSKTPCAMGCAPSPTL